MGPKEGESISGGLYPDMTQGYIWNRILGGTEDAARSLERAEAALVEAKTKGDMSGKEMAILKRSVDNLRATALAAESANRRATLGDYQLEGIHIHRQSSAVVGGSGMTMSDNPILFCGRNGMHVVVETMLDTVRSSGRDTSGDGPDNHVFLGVEVLAIERDFGSSMYVVRGAGEEVAAAADAVETVKHREEGSDSDASESDGNSSTKSSNHVLGSFDYVCICTPPAQIPPLLDGVVPDDHFILDALQTVSAAPVWAVVMEFEVAPPFAFQGAYYQPAIRSVISGV